MIEGKRTAVGRLVAFVSALLRRWLRRPAEERSSGRARPPSGAPDVGLPAAAPGGIGPAGRRGWDWDVAFSYASAQRHYVHEVAAALGAGGVRCFYDRDTQNEMWGKSLPSELGKTYSETSAVVVIFFSAEYRAGKWTRWELEAALSRDVDEPSEYILPARFDDTVLPRFLQSRVAVDLRDYSPARFADLIRRKLDRLGVSGPASEDEPSSGIDCGTIAAGGDPGRAGPGEAAVEAAALLDKLCDSIADEGWSGPAGVLRDRAVEVGQHGREPVAAFDRLVAARGLEPATLIPGLAGHGEAMLRWSGSTKEHITTVESRDLYGVVVSFRQVLALELSSGELFPDVSQGCQTFLEAALRGDEIASITDFLRYLSDRLRPRRADRVRPGGRSPRDGSRPATSKRPSADAREGRLTAAARRESWLPPPPPQDVVGRSDLILQITQKIRKKLAGGRPVTVFLSGQPGVGTTTVAVEAARALAEDFPGGVLYIDLHGLEDVRKDDRTIVEIVSRALSFPLNADSARRGRDDDDLFAEFAERLDGRRVLLVLDHAADADHVRRLARLPAKCATIIVSADRNQPQAIPGLVFRIDKLTTGAATEILGYFAGVRARDEAQLATLARFCDNVPKALVLVGARMANYPDWTLDRFALELEEESTRLDHLRGLDLAISLSYRYLPREEQWVCHLIAATPGAVTSGFELGHGLEKPPNGQEVLLCRIVDRSLAQSSFDATSTPPSTWFSLYEMVRLFVAKTLPEGVDGSELIHFQRRVVLFLRDRLRDIVAGDDRADASAELNPARFRAAERLAESLNWPDLASRILADLHELHTIHGQLDALADVHSRWVDVLRQRDDWSGVVRACLRNAASLRRLQADQRALNSARLAYQIATDESLDVLVAQAGLAVSDLLADREDWNAALAASAEAANALNRIDGNPTDILRAEINTARLALQAGHIGKESLSWCRAATKLADTQYFVSAPERAMAYFERARSERVVGNNPEALRSFRRAGNLFADLDWPNWWNAATAAGNAASVARALGDHAAELRQRKLAVHRWKREVERARPDQDPNMGFVRLVRAQIDLSAAHVANNSFELVSAVLDNAAATCRSRSGIDRRLALEVTARTEAARLLSSAGMLEPGGTASTPTTPVRKFQPPSATEAGSDDPELLRILALVRRCRADRTCTAVAKGELLRFLGTFTRYPVDDPAFWLYKFGST